MSEIDRRRDRANWIQYAITTAVAIVWSVFDRWARLQPVIEDWMHWVSPIAYMAIGAALGYMICKSLDKKKLDSKDAEIAAAVDAATKPLQERIDRLVNRRVLALARLRGLSLKELDIIRRFLAQDGPVLLKLDDASVRKLSDTGAIRINTDTYSPPDLFPFTLDDSLRSLLVEFPDALDSAIAEAESVKSRYKGGS